MADSSIEWTDATWNPVTGCTRLSPGCDLCYAVTMTRRLAAMGQTAKYGGLVNPGKSHFNGTVRTHDDALTVPLRKRKATTWFVNSMSDLFHKDVPFEFIAAVFGVMAVTPRHTYQILTKRPERMVEFFAWLEEDAAGEVPLASWCVRSASIAGRAAMIPEFDFDWWGDYTDRWPLPNVWLGTSVENQQTADERIPHLLRVPAAVRFLSMEPLLGEVDLLNYLRPICGECAGEGRVKHERGQPWERCRSCYGDGVHPSGIHWVITGAESGHGARPMDEAWVRCLRDRCAEEDVAFFYKQRLDERGHKVSLPLLDGVQHTAMPEVAR